MTAGGDGVSSGGAENALRLMAAQFCEWTKNH